MLKFCKKCELNKELSEFCRDASKKDGYQHSCKQCKYSTNKEWYINNREEYNKKRRESNIIRTKNRLSRRNKVKKELEKDPNWMRNHNLLKKFGITFTEYEQMVSDAGGCEICGLTQEQSLKIEGRRLCVDHCHSTGKIRGILCSKCNTALGKFKDSPEMLQRAIEYLLTK